MLWRKLTSLLLPSLSYSSHTLPVFSSHTSHYLSDRINRLRRRSTFIVFCWVKNTDRNNPYGQLILSLIISNLNYQKKNYNSKCYHNLLVHLCAQSFYLPAYHSYKFAFFSKPTYLLSFYLCVSVLQMLPSRMNNQVECATVCTDLDWRQNPLSTNEKFFTCFSLQYYYYYYIVLW